MLRAVRWWAAEDTHLGLFGYIHSKKVFKQRCEAKVAFSVETKRKLWKIQVKSFSKGGLWRQPPLHVPPLTWDSQSLLIKAFLNKQTKTKKHYFFNKDTMTVFLNIPDMMRVNKRTYLTQNPSVIPSGESSSRCHCAARGRRSERAPRPEGLNRPHARRGPPQRSACSGQLKKRTVMFTIRKNFKYISFGGGTLILSFFRQYIKNILCKCK